MATEKAISGVIKSDRVFARQALRSLRGQFSGWTDLRKRVRSDEILSAFVELERQVLTMTFYLESIQADSCR
jgi:hypothetical protein